MFNSSFFCDFLFHFSNLGFDPESLYLEFISSNQHKIILLYKIISTLYHFKRFINIPVCFRFPSSTALSYTPFISFLPYTFLLSVKIEEWKYQIWVIPEIYIGMGSSLIDPEEVRHCLRGSQKDHQAIQPIKNRQKILHLCRCLINRRLKLKV